MRKRIQQLAEGKFDSRTPRPVLSADKIELDLLEGKDVSGDFVVTSTTGVSVRGIVTSSNPRMECLTPQFEGVEVRVRYMFHGAGLAAGEVQKGSFCLVCNGGEYDLSFVVSVSGLYPDSSLGKIKNPDDFTRLAKADFDEAYRLFYSNHFKNFLKDENDRLLYEGLRGGTPSAWTVEEFLVAAKRKKRVELALTKNGAAFFGVTEDRAERIEIEKLHWGVFEARVVADGDFLETEKKTVTAEDFLGNSYYLEYYIRADRLHAGKNFGRILIETPGQSLEYRVTASVGRDGEERGNGRFSDKIRKEGRAKLAQLYIDYRLKRIVTGVWASRSIAILDRFLAFEPDYALWKLMKAQALLLNRQKQEASWILDEYKRSVYDKDTPLWGYYLYLCTLMEREESYVDRLTAEIEALAARFPDDALLFWILLFVKEDYFRNVSKRLRALEQWVLRGNNSPYLYLEAYYIFWQDPYLLGKLGDFEIRILNWAAKQDVISKDMAMQVRLLLPQQKTYEPRLYPALVKCYAADDSPEMVAAVCAYLIRGQRFGKECHFWYQAGIENEVRITNLYEAFLLSLDPNEVTPLPQMLQMYFQYASSVPWQNMAVFYVNMIAEKNKHPELYRRCRRGIADFAIRQLAAGHIDENMAVVYREVWAELPWDDRLAADAANVLFVHKLSCGNPKIVSATVLNAQTSERQTVAVTDGQAYFSAYTNDYVVVLSDADGHCFAGHEFYSEEALLPASRYVGKCMELSPLTFAYALFHFAKKTGSGAQFLPGDGDRLRSVLASKRLRPRYAARLLPEALRALEREGLGDEIGQYLADVSMAELGPADRGFLIGLLIDAQAFDRAYGLVHAYGYENVPGEKCARLCSYEVTGVSFEEDEYLLGMAGACFLAGAYNDVVLIYLCKFYEAPTKQMAQLWKVAGGYGIDTFDLEERILTQMLYSTGYVEKIGQIYESYCAGGGRELVRMAYLSYFAHSYLVSDMVVPEHVFAQLMQRYAVEEGFADDLPASVAASAIGLNDACRLGLLKFLSTREKLSKEEALAAESLLARYTAENLYFSFYKKFEDRLLQKYFLYDKFFVEYHTDGGKRVLLTYSVNGGGFVKEELTEVYGGIYEKAFVLFFGESVSYYVAELCGAEWKTVESGQLSNHNYDGREAGRYDCLNGMAYALAMRDAPLLKERREQYERWERAAKKEFRRL